MKSRQRLMILGGILVVIAVFLSYGLISSTIKFFGGTKSNVYYEEEIMLGDTTCQTRTQTLVTSYYDTSTPSPSCSGFNQPGTCYTYSSADSSQCGPDDGADCYFIHKYSVTCDDVLVCGSGEYVDGNKCSKCPAGTAKKGESSAKSCTNCTGNTYAPGQGNYVCINVPSGAEVTNDHTGYNCKPGFGKSGNGCVACTAGTKKAGYSNAACSACEGDTFSERAAVTCTSCSNLPTGYYCDNHQKKQCNGTVSEDKMSCIEGYLIATFTCSDKVFNDGKSQTLATCTGCTLENAEQTAPKEYTITATLEDGYRWNSSGEAGTKTCKAKITCPTGQKANAAETGCESAITLNCGTGYVGERITCSVSSGMINGSSSSNNPSVARVEGSGSSFITVLGIKAGTATITTTVNGSTVSGTVTIKDASKPITKISIDGPSSIEIGTSAESRQYTAVVTPTDHDDKIQWSSSNTSIATIGASGVLYAVAGGEVTITARAVVGNISATKKVKITVNSNCSVTATNVSGFKHMSINETEQASFTINGKSCGTQIDIKRSYFKGASTTLSGETESFTPTSTCVTGSIKGCIKGTTVCSNSITIELRPTWSGPKVLAAVAKSTYENAPKSASAANVAGKDYYYDEGCPLNSKKGVYENCNYYYRGCGGGGGSSAVPHCYVNGDDYKWEYTAPSGYTLVENVTKEENCRKEEEPACYKDSSGEYHWGKYATTDGYEVVPSIKNENACKKPSETEETYACYKKDNDYTWASSQPEGYELVPDKNTPESCAPAEEPACYLYNGEFTWGPYKNRNGYILLENITSEDKCKSTSNACYKDKNGNYVWGDYENNNDYEIVPGITSLEDCAPETPVPITDINVSKLVYAFMTILMAFGIGFIYYASVLKKNN